MQEQGIKIQYRSRGSKKECRFVIDGVRYRHPKGECETCLLDPKTCPGSSSYQKRVDGGEKVHG